MLGIIENLLYRFQVDITETRIEKISDGSVEQVEITALPMLINVNNGLCTLAEDPLVLKARESQKEWRQL